jgi:hypothetical protein
MTPYNITATLQDHEQFQPHDDSFLAQVDDEALERALKTVNWNPRDVAQFLRNAAFR